MKTNALPVLGLACLFSCLAFPAHANTGSSVGGPTVDKGKTAIEYRIAMSEDDESRSQDERIRTRLHIDHAFTEVYAARLVVALDKREGQNIEHEGLSLQNRFHLIRKKDYGFDGGFRLNYTLADGDKKPDVASLRFYQQIPCDKWEVRFNQIIEHEVGEDADSGVILEWRSQATYAVTDRVRLGLDAFHDFGNMNFQNGYSAQEHASGPVLKAKFGGGYSMEAAFRLGISRGSADQSATLIFTRTW